MLETHYVEVPPWQREHAACWMDEWCCVFRSPFLVSQVAFLQYCSPTQTEAVRGSECFELIRLDYTLWKEIRFCHRMKRLPCSQTHLVHEVPPGRSDSQAGMLSSIYLKDSDKPWQAVPQVCDTRQAEAGFTAGSFTSAASLDLRSWKKVAIQSRKGCDPL